MGIVAGRGVPDTLWFDICVVGAGAGGLSFASNFLDKKHSVVVLESGGVGERPSPSEAGGDLEEGLAYAQLATSRLRGFGGSTQVLGWGGLCKPLDAQDFEARPWVPDSGWPFGVDQLKYYYERAGETLGLGGIETLARRQEVFPERSSVLSVDSLELCRHYRLGAHFRGPFSRSASINVMTMATVLYLEFADDGASISAIVCADPEGKQFRIKSKLCVLAAGGIENPRILLVSYLRARREPGLIGKYFMDHPRFAIGKLTPANGDTRAALARLDRIRIARRQRLAHWLGMHRQRRYLVQGLTLPFEVQREHRLLNYRAWIEPQYTGQDWEVLDNIKQSLLARRDRTILQGRQMGWGLLETKDIGWTKGMHLARPPMLARSFRLHHFLEPEPLRESAVSLSSQTDRFGLPLPTVSWQLADNTLNSLRRTISIIREELQNSGIGKLDVAPEEWEKLKRPMWTWHHMGTTRMHEDRSSGVVDANCRVHGLTNLFIAGSSVFPKGGNDTPTLTIVALAHRLADHLLRTVS
jgi:choline dehydrogenase-like flavoprotein